MGKNRAEIRLCGRFFEADIEEAAKRIESAPGGELLTDNARKDIREDLGREISNIADSTVKKYLTEYIAKDNPLALLDFALSTKEQLEDAENRLGEDLELGKISFPPLLCHEVRARLMLLSEGVSGMLFNFCRSLDEISNSLFDGKKITAIERIVLFAGDAHNRGRGAAFVRTDAGVLMIKPRSGLTDKATYQLVCRYFQDVMKIPKTWTDGHSFTACEFIEKKRAEGKEEAAEFYKRMGGMTAVLQALGSSDMHVENVTCVGDMPVILDIETILTPEKRKEEGVPFADYAIAESALMTGLHAGNIEEFAVSPLLNTEDGGCAPEVDGRRVSVLEYFDEYLQGFISIRERIEGIKKELFEEIPKLYGNTQVRVLLRNTDAYIESLLHIYLAKYFASEQAYQAVREKLRDLCRDASFMPIYNAELTALMRGDVPLFTVPCSTRDLYADGVCVVKDMYEKSPVEHALGRLQMVNGEDTKFQVQLLRRFFTTALVKEPQERPVKILPARKLLPEPISLEAAKKEGFALLGEVYRDMLVRDDGSSAFVYGSEENGSIVRMLPGLYQGYAGLGLFAEKALLALKPADGEYKEESDDTRVREEALSIIRTALLHTDSYGREMTSHLSKEGAKDSIRLPFGEGTGIGGVLPFLTGAEKLKESALLDEEAPIGLPDPKTLSERIFTLSVRGGLSALDEADQIGGLAGLISGLCESFMRDEPVTEELIVLALERLLYLENLPYTYPDGEKVLLWKTIRQKRPVSGRGHGMAGIAEALVLAAEYLVSLERKEKKETEETACDESAGAKRIALAAKALSAARAALVYEDRTFREDLETWPDLRLKQTGFMHGLCSGAPGIGISMIRIITALSSFPEPVRPAYQDISFLAKRNLERARKAVFSIPLLYSDHLCCGNAAIVLFLLLDAQFIEDTQKTEEGRRCAKEKLRYAGSILAAMKARKDEMGEYQVSSPDYRPIENHTLFYGTSGAGYVMLSYAEAVRTLGKKI